MSEPGNSAKGHCGRGRFPQPGRIARGLLCASLVVTAGYLVPAQKSAGTAGSESAYENGQVVRFTPVMPRWGKGMVVGDLRLGRVLADPTPNDHRDNVYVVCPGAKPEPGKPGENFRLVLSTMPRTEAPLEWDIYWVIVLDPTLPTSFTSESDLLMAAQKAFTPGPDFSFSGIPGAALLRKYLHIDSREGLAPFQVAGGDLPKLIMVPAHMAIRASAVAPDAPPPQPSPLVTTPPQSSLGNAK